MKISLNGKTANIDKRGCRHFKHLMEKVQKELLAQNEVVVSVISNGTEYANLDENLWADIPSPQIQDLQIVTSSIKELSLQSISDVQEYLLKVHGVLQGVRKDIGTKKNSGKAIASFHDVIKLFDGWILPIIDRLTTLYKISLQDITIQGVPAIQSINDFIESIDAGVSHLERSAFEDFSHCLEERTLLHIRHIQGLFDHLHQYIKTHSR
ncbi:hypothetical protein LGV61_01430 [Desulfurispirillum indicum]|uniref:Uncharacterized protein n=1 Tax=Desulfurispirillum indicum (strain ATCC BAA-1389 / DSM 22839 / S5) TaxID=653733 RepID=E6W6Q6_DESIS|nr:hypothetical protein [Desulfurispirillum indicum]ADU65056.1 hypothetical protein Selin_0300 [Desulfurispirillum indicum S5]UCZ56964.1 hypothetical protein LGV61_01430 [Desulfurispirillum indicum]